LKTAMILSTVIAGAALAMPVGSPGQAAELVRTELLRGMVDGRVLYSYPAALVEGQELDSWHGAVAAPFDGYLVLVDDMALANWEHPCRWVFVSPEGRLQAVDMTTPPMALQRMTVEYTDLPAPEGDARQRILDWWVPNPSEGNDPEHTYAWIISGGANQGNNHIRYYGDVQFLYLTLTDDYGYTNDHIVICFADGLNPAVDNSDGQNSNPDLDGDGTQDFDYDATFAGITSGWNDIQSLVGPDDHLLLFTTDHGGNGKSGQDVPPEAYLNLWNFEEWNDDSYDTWIDTFDTISFNVAMEQCFSGGFLAETIPTTGGMPRTFTSAANGTESSWAGNTFPEYDEWAYWWVGAQHGSVPQGGSYPGGALPGEPDQNGDGYVSYGEAANCALLWDAYAQSGQEHPQYDDDPSSCGDDYYMGGDVPSQGVGDGQGPFATALSCVDNPFTGSATFVFSLSTPANVDLTVMDLAGRQVAVLAGGYLPAGSHSRTWNAADVPAGLYMVRLSSGGHVETARIVKIR
jgi:hypothetical protein